MLDFISINCIDLSLVELWITYTYHEGHLVTCIISLPILNFHVFFIVLFKFHVYDIMVHGGAPSAPLPSQRERVSAPFPHSGSLVYPLSLSSTELLNTCSHLNLIFTPYGLEILINSAIYFANDKGPTPISIKAL